VLEILEAGPALTLQDSGRPGYQRYGVTEGGAIDRYALAEGNALLGNSKDTVALEMPLVGGKFRVTSQSVMVATSGAEMNITLDGQPIRWRSSFLMQPEQILHCGYTRKSVYSYLHVKDGFDIPQVLGSRSTHVRSSFGGFEGRILESGDRLPLAYHQQSDGFVAKTLLPATYLDTDVIRIVWGPQAHLFAPASRELLLNSEFQVTAQRDRMGARLSHGDSGGLIAVTGLTGVSDAVVRGDLQVAGDGVATVLLADRQPTGGYPRIATVISADLNAIAQMETNKIFRFQVVDIDEAVEALNQLRLQIDTIPQEVSNVIRQPEEIPDLLGYNLIDGVVKAQKKFTSEDKA